MSQTVAERIRFWSIPLGIMIIAALLVVLLVQKPEQAPPAAEDLSMTAVPEQPDLTFVEERNADDVQAIGPVDAPVGLVIYSDYQCKFCAKWTNDTLPTMKQYAEQGDLRIEWRDVNQYGADSERASLAAHAAGKQGKYWEYHDMLFPNGTALAPDQLTEEALIARAAELGLDTAQFTTDLRSPESLLTVQQYAEQGRQLGVTGTPSFILGGVPVVGAQPTSVFVDLLEQQLSAAKQ